MLVQGPGPGVWKGAPPNDTEPPDPPDNGDMEERVTALEKDMKDVRERLIKIEAKIDNLPTIFATKGDLAEAKFQIIVWVAGVVVFAQLLPMVVRALN